MFINCKKNVSFPLEDGRKYRIPAGYLGEVTEEKITEHWYFKLLCKDGTITFCESKRDNDIEAAQKAAAEKDAAEAAEAEKKRLIDEAKENARIAAEKEAEEKGLDATATKKLITRRQNEAVTALTEGD